jgi:hypothetical protein
MPVAPACANKSHVTDCVAPIAPDYLGIDRIDTGPAANAMRVPGVDEPAIPEGLDTERAFDVHLQQDLACQPE